LVVPAPHITMRVTERRIACSFGGASGGERRIWHPLQDATTLELL
jgi:hypothetical protein